jgi:pimeloyl-ACP methyl ester carboxylesterase
MAIDIQRQLAVALSEAGIASLRYDKRGVGSSEGDETLASRSDLLDDARAAIAALRAQPEIDPSRVILIGHSEGAYLAPILAVDDPTIAGVILLSGAARPLSDITLWQVQTLLAQGGADEAAVDAALEQQTAYIDFVKSSKGEWSDYTVSDLEMALPWLTDTSAAQLLSSSLALSWLREHYLADPVATLSHLKAPVLVISGEKDLQVPSSEAGLIQDAVEAGENDDVSVQVLPNLNHLLRTHPEDANLLYRHIQDPVDPRVIDLIQTWILDRFGS